MAIKVIDFGKASAEQERRWLADFPVRVAISKDLAAT
jgi:hypothetical protein